jgi:hypothetical protein
MGKKSWLARPMFVGFLLEVVWCLVMLLAGTEMGRGWDEGKTRRGRVEGLVFIVLFRWRDEGGLWLEGQS